MTSPSTIRRSSSADGARSAHANVGAASPPWRRERWIAAAAIVVAGLVLLRHAMLYDFVCDDAFITLRYARNLGRLGAPVYNPGQRVEGYTDFLWMVLNAVAVIARAAPIRWVHALGALSGVGLLASAWALWMRFSGGRPWGGVVVVMALALAAPVAAWTLGGLETPLFAALVTLGLALAADLGALADRRPRRPIAAGLVLALATLTRPEGALFFTVAFGVIAWQRIRDAHGRRVLAWLALGYVGVVLPFVIWRWRYYGYPLPNTYYVKFSGARLELWKRGGNYLWLAVRDLGFVLVALTLGAVVMKTPMRIDDTDDTVRVRRAAFMFARVLLPIFVLYVASVGGDFLDLYRFLVPVLPLAFAAIVAQFAERAALRDDRRTRIAVVALAVAALAGHAYQQGRLGSRALIVDEPERVKFGVEPIGWTRLFALRWAAMGRWLGRHASPGEWMASGAAGAMAFYSGLNNLDTLGLCDPYVAHQGDVIGDRPGHQRFAPHAYVVERRPVFIMIGDQSLTDDRADFERDPTWEAEGWTWVEVRVGARDGAPGEFFHRVLVRTDRLAAWGDDPDVRRAGH